MLVQTGFGRFHGEPVDAGRPVNGMRLNEGNTPLRTNDPLVLEVREARERHAARIGHDLKQIFRDIRVQQGASGRTCVTYLPRPLAPKTSASADLQRLNQVCEGNPMQHHLVEKRRSRFS